MLSRKKKSILPASFEPEVCKGITSFDECELAILQDAVKKSQRSRGFEIVHDLSTKHIVEIVEAFLRKEKTVCYGGTAINNILPENAQFYDKDTEIPDYDFFCLDPVALARKLADQYVSAGFVEVSATPAVHLGTIKVFVNYIAVADISILPASFFKRMFEESVVRDGIHYAPPNFLRMGMYTELSRPRGDVSRWEKVLTRLNLLNEHYPFEPPKHCWTQPLQRSFDVSKSSMKNQENVPLLHDLLRDTFAEERCVFFGGFAARMYATYMPQTELRRKLEEGLSPDFDVLHEDADYVANRVKEVLETSGLVSSASVQFHENVGELIPNRYQILVGDETVAFVYQPIACHSYNVMEVNDKNVRVATIDTILCFYLSFMYSDEYVHDRDRLLCIATLLFEVEMKNRLSQTGLLKRFSLQCVGTQPSMADMKREKMEKWKELQKHPDPYLKQLYFFKYPTTTDVPVAAAAAAAATTTRKKKRGKKQTTSSPSSPSSPSWAPMDRWSKSYASDAQQHPPPPRPQQQQRQRRRKLPNRRRAVGANADWSFSDWLVFPSAAAKQTRKKRAKKSSIFL